MTVSRPSAMVLSAFIALMLLLWGMTALMSWRDAGNARLERALARQAEIRALTEEYARLSPSAPRAPGEKQTLFSLVNGEAERLRLARRIEAARPSVRQSGRSEGKGRGEPVELLELRMTGLYLKQCVEWLHALESLPGLRIETLRMQRAARERLDLDLSLSRAEDAP